MDFGNDDVMTCCVPYFAKVVTEGPEAQWFNQPGAEDANKNGDGGD